MFEHTEGDMDKLAHEGADDAHFRFAGGAKPGSEVAQGRVVFDGYQGRHVEGLAQVAVALFAYSQALLLEPRHGLPPPLPQIALRFAAQIILEERAKIQATALRAVSRFNKPSAEPATGRWLQQD